MNPLTQQFKKYLEEVLDLQVVLKTWKDKDIFPLFLHGLYDFYQADIFKKNYLILLAKTREVPKVICKHIGLVEEKTGIPCIYVNSRVNSINYKILINHRILFVIPGKLIYLPSLGMDWVENCRLSRKFQSSHKPLSPVAQTIAIYALIHSGQKNFTLKHLAKALSYTSMSISRALDELEGRDLGSTVRKDKERVFHLRPTSREFWKALLLLLKSPVRKRIWIRCKESPPGFLAGISALSKFTDLAEPEYPVYAIGYKQYQTLSLATCDEQEDGSVELEVWHYDPSLFATSGHVDLFSLYLSLKEIQDEQVEEALEKMIMDILC
ncbi:MAG TPA: hypothetical protein DCE71_08500 [Parachlamydiales bacterium]|nr:hypothetical protein [Parachlamydiales bacterium]